MEGKEQIEHVQQRLLAIRNSVRANAETIGPVARFDYVDTKGICNIAFLSCKKKIFCYFI